MQWYQRRVHGDRSLNLQRIFFLSLLKNCNHKRLGIYYLLSAFIFGISGTLISVPIRIELYSSGNRIISPENQNFYNISITLHGLLMIFFLVMPGLFGGFGNYFVVIFQGSPEVVYPRVNNFSILILFLSYLFLILSLISEFGGGTGWTLYPPLSTSFMSLSPSSTGNLLFRQFIYYILIIPAFGIVSIIISGISQKIIFGNQSMIFAMSCISLLGSVVWGHHMYTVGLETDTRAYFSGVTILISLPTGTKIFNWLSTYLGNPPLLQLRTSSSLFALLFLLM